MNIRLGSLWPCALDRGLAGCAVATAQTGRRLPNPGVPWPAIDALGRRLPPADTPDVPGPRADRFVGMFYFLWHDNHGRPSGPTATARMMFPRSWPATRTPSSTRRRRSGGRSACTITGPSRSMAITSSTDPWVIRRHAQLLAAAGVDTLIFDTTNAVTYPRVYRKLCEVYHRNAQGREPHAADRVHGQHERRRDAPSRFTTISISPGHYRDLWFHLAGQAALDLRPGRSGPRVRAFFNLRRAHWPFTQVNTRNAWHWEATYPQVYGYTDDPARPEQVNVSVAQNLRASDGQVTNMSAGDARGRSFHDGARDQTAGAVDRGGNFQEQWKRALALDPPFVMVTGWNEWIAGRWGKPDGPIEFVDQFDQEFSRDIEPMKGGHGDNYYYQLVANVRAIQGHAPPARGTSSRPIDDRRWFRPVARCQAAICRRFGDTLPRDHDGAGGLHYTSTGPGATTWLTSRSRDSQNLSFYARTRARSSLVECTACGC